jgi:hypothetical protein
MVCRGVSRQVVVCRGSWWRTEAGGVRQAGGGGPKRVLGHRGVRWLVKKGGGDWKKVEVCEGGRV